MITLCSEPARLASERGFAIATEDVIALDAVDERMPILADIEKLMNRRDVAVGGTAGAA